MCPYGISELGDHASYSRYCKQSKTSERAVWCVFEWQPCSVFESCKQKQWVAVYGSRLLDCTLIEECSVASKRYRCEQFEQKIRRQLESAFGATKIRRPLSTGDICSYHKTKVTVKVCQDGYISQH